MKLEKFKEKDNKRVGIVVFTIVCLLLVSGAILYRTFAIFEVRTNQNVIKGTVQDPGNIYFAFYQKNEDSGDYEVQKDIPTKENGYVLDEEKSYCGVTGENDPNIKVFVTEDNMIHVSGVTTSRTKCNLYFTKGIFLMGLGVPIVSSGDGLYEVEHKDVTGTIDDTGFGKKEYRYAGASPNNYIMFNNEPWRIIGLVNVMTSEDKAEQRIKIVKNTPLEQKPWDSDNKNDWTKSSLMTYLNSGYYDQLKDNTKSMIDENITWNIGGSNKTDLIVSEFYNKERGTETFSNQSSKWKKGEENNFHGIGLIYPSDFWLATNGGDIGREQCFEYPLYTQETKGWDSNEGTSCRDNDWLKPNNSNLLWTLTASSTNNVVYVIDSGHLGNNAPQTLYFVLPTLYLKTNVKIYFGNGTEENPFQLKQEIYG